MRGGLTTAVLPMLCHDTPWALGGIYRALSFDAEEDIVANAEFPAGTGMAAIAGTWHAVDIATQCVAKLLAASEEHAADLVAGSSGSWATMNAIGLDQRGDQFVTQFMDPMASGWGARSHADGIDTAGIFAAPGGVATNVESNELAFPMLYLARREETDSGGPGEYRGGAGHEYAVTPVGEEVEEVDVVTFGRAVDVPASTGMFGGHPGSTVDYSFHRDVGVTGDVLPDGPDRAADREDGRWGVAGLDDDDVFSLRFPGSGGYGDPLERDPETVAADVARGDVSPESARSVYGVPVTDDGEIDGSVEESRDRIRAERLERADPAGESADPGPTEPTDRRLGESLRVVEGGEGNQYSACVDCGHVFAAVTDDWKAAAPQNERPLSDSGRNHDGGEEFCLREFVCPDCARLLDLEVTLREDPPLTSRLL